MLNDEGGSMSDWVRLSDLKDQDGKPMLLICGAHYPQEIARHIAKEVLKFIPVDGGPTIISREQAEWIKAVEEHRGNTLKLAERGRELQSIGLQRGWLK